MSTPALTIDLARPALPRLPRARLVRAELLKLRRRRGLIALTAVLTLLPMLLTYGISEILHHTDPAGNGPSGGVDNLYSSLDALSLLATVAAILVGVTAGAGDLGAGVFRELVTTGRSRWALFAARVPGGLLFLLPFVALSYAVAAVASVAFAGSLPSPDAGELAIAAGWALLVPTASFALALGVAALVGSRSAAIAGVLAWQFVVGSLIVAAGFLGAAREGFASTALDSLRPTPAGEAAAVPMAPALALLVVAAWIVVPLAIGAWRTATRDA